MSSSLISGRGNITSVTQEETTLASVLRKQLPGVKFLVPNDSGGTTALTSEQLADNLEAHVTSATELATYRAQGHVMTEKADQQLALNRAAAIVVRNYVALTFGESSAAYAAFGFAPRKTRQVKPAVQTEAIAKRAATRAARHTMGRRQRAAIHGVVTVPAPAPVAVETSPAASADAPAAASPAGAPMVASPNKAA